MRKCASIHFAAALRYAANKRKRAPPFSGIGQKPPREIRLTEYNNACEILNQMGRVHTNSVGYELFSLCHVVCTGNHDRDNRGFYLFVSELLRDSGCALRAFDVIAGRNETASLQINVFVAQDQMRGDYIDLLSYGEHTYWIQPSGETAMPNWEKWDLRLSKHIRFFPSMRWKDILPNRPESERSPLFAKCKHCRMCGKSSPKPADFYEVSGIGFGKPSLFIPEFRMGRRLSLASPNGDSAERDEAVEISERDESDILNICSTMTTHELNWAFGDLYSTGPDPSNPAASPRTHLPLALPGTSPFIAPINPEWPTGSPHDKRWRHTLFSGFTHL